MPEIFQYDVFLCHGVEEDKAGGRPPASGDGGAAIGKKKSARNSTTKLTERKD